MSISQRLKNSSAAAWNGVSALSLTLSMVALTGGYGALKGFSDSDGRARTDTEVTYSDQNYVIVVDEGKAIAYKTTDDVNLSVTDELAASNSVQSSTSDLRSLDMAHVITDLNQEFKQVTVVGEHPANSSEIAKDTLIGFTYGALGGLGILALGGAAVGFSETRESIKPRKLINRRAALAAANERTL